MIQFSSAHEDVALAVPAKTSPQGRNSDACGGSWPGTANATLGRGRPTRHLAEDGQRYSRGRPTLHLANATLLGCDFVEAAGGVGD